MYFSRIAVAGGAQPKCGWCGKNLRPTVKVPELRTLMVSIRADDEVSQSTGSKPRARKR